MGGLCAAFAPATGSNRSGLPRFSQAPAQCCWRKVRRLNVPRPPRPRCRWGVRETLDSIFIPPKPKAPFTLTLDTEWTRAFGNGGTYTLVNERHIARDSAGRIHEERWYLVPKNGKRESTMNYIQIGDPTNHTLYNCQVELKRCYLLTYTGSTAGITSHRSEPRGPLPEGNGFHTHEDLGTNSIDGFDTSGYRETTTINAGVYGNDQQMVTTREFWYAPQLGINLLSKVDSPQAGKTFTVTEISSPSLILSCSRSLLDLR